MPEITSVFGRKKRIDWPSLQVCQAYWPIYHPPSLVLTHLAQTDRNLKTRMPRCGAWPLTKARSHGNRSNHSLPCTGVTMVTSVAAAAASRATVCTALPFIAARWIDYTQHVTIELPLAINCCCCSYGCHCLNCTSNDDDVRFPVSTQGNGITNSRPFNRSIKFFDAIIGHVTDTYAPLLQIW